MLVVHHTCTMIWSELTAGSTVLWHSPILHTDMGWKPIIYGIYWLKTHYCPLSFGGGDQTLDLHRLGQEFYHKAASDASHLLVLNMVSTSCSGWAMNLLCSPGCQWTWGPPTSVLLPCSWDYRHERVRPANSCFILQRGKPYIFEHWYLFHSPLASVLPEFLESRLCLPSLLSSAPRIDCSCQCRWCPGNSDCLKPALSVPFYVLNLPIQHHTLAQSLLFHTYNSSALPQITEALFEWLIKTLVSIIFQGGANRCILAGRQCEVRVGCVW